MKDVLEVIKNIEEIYRSDMAFTVLKDFERVIDDLDIYVYDNWADGEIVSGPKISKHWVTCAFMWDLDKMPDPMGGKRLLDYDCKVTYKKDKIIKPRKIRQPGDVRPMTKKLIADIYGGYKAQNEIIVDPAVQAPSVPAETQTAEVGAEATAGTEEVV